MKDLKIKVSGNSYSLLENELNILVVADSKFIAQLPDLEDNDIVSYNVLADKGEMVTTNDFSRDISIGLTKSYLSSIENRDLKKSQVLLIEVIGVGYTGFCEVYAYLKSIVSEVRAVVLFMRMDTLFDCFELAIDTNILLSQEQVNIKKDENKLRFSLKV